MNRILLVDDNPTLLKQTSLLLAGTYTIMMAKSGETALEIATRQAPDIILLDVEMPGMDGFQTLAALKKNAALAQIPVIFLTANHDTETQVRALQAGAVDFIKKPFEFGVLMHRLNVHLNLSQYQLGLEKKLRDLEDSIIVSFAELIECRDSFSGGHVQRVCALVERLGSFLMQAGEFSDELDESSHSLFARASALHDVGKIGVSDLIMLKPGRFTPEEHAEAQKHASIGARTLEAAYALAPIPLLRHAATIAESHHERFDGTGYPKGLKGSAIPLCARMTAVVNVYDSLLFDAVYRPGKTHEEVCRIIAEGAGTEF
ncbi:response regulator, partial [Desulfovibrio sp. OttesenSCG-928-G15]|nr:response regulator [Desulfovibrio sp. OttesenSCG-928-G15]